MTLGAIYPSYLFSLCFVVRSRVLKELTSHQIGTQKRMIKVSIKNDKMRENIIKNFKND